MPSPQCPTKPIYDNVNFYSPEMVSKFSHLAKIQPSLDASFSFGTAFDGSPYSCSGAYRSNSGHFSTALHCLRMCLVQTGHMRQTGRTKVVRTGMPFPAMCTVQTSNGAVQVKILASGECWAENKKDCSGEHDFIFGQVEGKKTACEKMRARPSQKGETVATIGTPSGKTKGREYNPDGIRVHFSLGKILDPYSDACDEVFILPDGTKQIRRKANKRRIGGMGSDAYETVNERVEGLERISADATFASSGGSVIDANGEAIGIITNGTYNEERECIGGTLFNPIAPIMSKLRQQLSTQQINELTNCK